MPCRSGARCAQNAIQSIAELRRLELFGILAADRGDRVGIDDAALEKIEGTVKLGMLHRINIPREQQLLHRLAGKTTPEDRQL